MTENPKRNTWSRIWAAPLHPNPDNVRWRILFMIGDLTTQPEPNKMKFKSTEKSMLP